MDSQFINICKYGTYYNPAEKHYDNQVCDVICDRCRKQKLAICIGWENFDLCLRCVEDVNSQLHTDSFDRKI